MEVIRLHDGQGGVLTVEVTTDDGTETGTLRGAAVRNTSSRDAWGRVETVEGEVVVEGVVASGADNERRTLPGPLRRPLGDFRWSARWPA